MTSPRYVVPDQTVFITLRAVGRSFRFLPTRQVRELIDYALAVMSKEHGILLHELEFLSNHGHLLLTDVHGVLPDSMRDLASLLSRSLNVHRGHRGTNIRKGLQRGEADGRGQVLRARGLCLGQCLHSAFGASYEALEGNFVLSDAIR